MRQTLITVFYMLFIKHGLLLSQSLGRVGSNIDKATTTSAGTVLMGGGSDVDAAFTWMINKSGGGDFVVIRATGTNAYNDFIYGLGTANSVETIKIDSKTLANDSAIVEKIKRAEAIFFAGGDQNDYLSNYKGTALGIVLDSLANKKQVPIGGTSAGMAIQGCIYYDGITNVLSQEVLSNPYKSATGIHYNDFLLNPYLQNTITDTHFNTKGGTTSNGITGRQGRLMSFLSRMITDQSLTDVKAIACDEKTAVCIDETGIAMVVGVGKAHFLRQWCAAPETCVAGQPLNWSNGTKVYSIKGTSYTAPPTTAKSVNLNDWTTVSGGNYEYWTVNNGILTLSQTVGTPADCLPLSIDGHRYADGIEIYPNPTEGFSTVYLLKPVTGSTISVINITGQTLSEIKNQSGGQFDIDISGLGKGVYFVEIKQNGTRAIRRIILH